MLTNHLAECLGPGKFGSLCQTVGRSPTSSTSLFPQRLCSVPAYAIFSQHPMSIGPCRCGSCSFSALIAVKIRHSRGNQSPTKSAKDVRKTDAKAPASRKLSASMASSMIWAKTANLEAFVPGACHLFLASCTACEKSGLLDQTKWLAQLCANHTPNRRKKTVKRLPNLQGWAFE